MTDPRDPLVGLDPYPRELIDTLALHPERADLLEDIVSTPSPASPGPTRTRVLLALGVAAAIAIIGGGWFLASGTGGHDETPVAAASTAPTTTPSATASSTMSPNGAATSATGGRCRHLLARSGQLRGLLRVLGRDAQGRRVAQKQFYVRLDRRGHKEYVVVGPGCRLRTLQSLRAGQH